MAGQAIEGLQQATKSLEQWNSRSAMVNELQTRLASVRSELTAYAEGCMDDDLQVAEFGFPASGLQPPQEWRLIRE
jgi:hypothetical protein